MVWKDLTGRRVTKYCRIGKRPGWWHLCTPLYAGTGGWDGGQWMDFKETLEGNT